MYNKIENRPFAMNCYERIFIKLTFTVLCLLLSVALKQVFSSFLAILPSENSFVSLHLFFVSWIHFTVLTTEPLWRHVYCCSTDRLIQKKWNKVHSYDKMVYFVRVFDSLLLLNFLSFWSLVNWTFHLVRWIFSTNWVIAGHLTLC
jgi:hypothetical protein